MFTLGVDIGSSCVKVALWDGRGFSFALGPAAWDFADSAPELVRGLCADRGAKPEEVAFTVATGYGRKLYQKADKTVTEITCHAAGAVSFRPGARTVLDIGGQDSKVISLGEDGSVKDFLMNDKCAAGTGRFLQNMAALIGCPLDDFAAIPPETEPQKINSMCTVFAESEVISLLSRGAPKAAVMLGLLDAIAARAAGMVSRLSGEGLVTFTGGAAKNPLLAARIAASLGRPVEAPEHPQFAGAAGAALIAAELAVRKTA